jgi:hypothetical protein
MQVAIMKAMDIIQKSVSNIYKNSLKQRSINMYFWKQWPDAEKFWEV